VLLITGAVVGYHVLSASQHRNFLARGCLGSATDNCRDYARLGRTYDIASNTLWITGGVLAVATLVTGLAFVEWSNGKQTVNVTPTAGGAFGTYSLRY
jgi:hypothetical protein